VVDPSGVVRGWGGVMRHEVRCWLPLGARFHCAHPIHSACFSQNAEDGQGDGGPLEHDPSLIFERALKDVVAFLDVRIVEEVKQTQQFQVVLGLFGA
jgi:hypothetical protein